MSFSRTLQVSLVVLQFFVRFHLLLPHIVVRYLDRVVPCLVFRYRQPHAVYGIRDSGVQNFFFTP